MKAVLRLIIASLFLAFGMFPALAKEVPWNGSRIQVIDEAKVLSFSDQQNLRRSLKAIERDTGAQVAVLTIKSLEGDDVKDFALRVARKWALGQRGKNNGLLVLYVQDSKTLRFEVGTGLEGALPDGKVGEIARDFQKSLSESKSHYKALSMLVEEISTIIYKESGVTKKSAEEVKNQNKEVDKRLILYGIATFISSLLGVAFWTKSLRYIPGGLVGGASWAVIAYYVSPEALIVSGIIGFVATIILSFFFRHGGDAVGFWPIPGGASDAIGGMASGAGDFAGGGAEAIGDAIGSIIGGLFGS